MYLVTSVNTASDVEHLSATVLLGPVALLRVALRRLWKAVMHTPAPMIPTGDLLHGAADGEGSAAFEDLVFIPAVILTVLMLPALVTHVLPGSVLYLPMLLLVLSPIVIIGSVINPLILRYTDRLIVARFVTSIEVRKNIRLFAFYTNALFVGGVFTMYWWSMTASLFSSAVDSPSRYLRGEGYVRTVTDDLASRSFMCYIGSAIQSAEQGISAVMSFV